jgi:hypothetical protein
MEGYLRDQRKIFSGFSNSSSLHSGCCHADVVDLAFFSPSSTHSSVTSQDLSDFITDFRQTFFALHPRENQGSSQTLTKEDLREVLFMLDQEMSAKMVEEMFAEVDEDGNGHVDLEALLLVMEKGLAYERKRVPTPSIKSATPPDSARAASRRVQSKVSDEYAATAGIAALSSSFGLPSPQREPSPPSAQHGASEKRPTSTISSKGRRDSGNGKITSSSGRKASRSQPVILWWGFQDLADTL